MENMYNLQKEVFTDIFPIPPLIYISIDHSQTHASPVINCRLTTDHVSADVQEIAKTEKELVSEIVRKDADHIVICFDLQK
jgi:hypothetical protein